MFKTIIIESDPKRLNHLKKLITESSPQLNIVNQSVDIEEASESIDYHIPDLVFISLSTNPKKIFDFFDTVKFIKIFFAVTCVSE